MSQIEGYVTVQVLVPGNPPFTAVIPYGGASLSLEAEGLRSVVDWYLDAARRVNERVAVPA